VKTAFPNKHYSGYCKAAEEKADQNTWEILDKVKKYGQQHSDMVGKRWRRHVDCYKCSIGSNKVEVNSTE